MRRGRAIEAACGFAVAASFLLSIAGCASDPAPHASPASSSAIKGRAAPAPPSATATTASDDDAPASEISDGGYARDPSPREPGRYWVAPDPDRPGRSRVVEVPNLAARSSRPAEAVPDPPPAPPASDPSAAPHLVEVKPTN